MHSLSFILAAAAIGFGLAIADGVNYEPASLAPPPRLPKRFPSAFLPFCHANKLARNGLAARVLFPVPVICYISPERTAFTPLPIPFFQDRGI